MIDAETKSNIDRFFEERKSGQIEFHEFEELVDHILVEGIREQIWKNGSISAACLKEYLDYVSAKLGEL